MTASKVVDVHGAIFGAELVGMGLLGLAAVFFPLEFAVYVGGPAVAVIALLYIVTKAIFHAPAIALALGATGFFLGVLLATHDYIWTGETAIMIHFGIAVATLVAGAFQLLTVGTQAPRKSSA